jgi:two-component system, cell cycle response regulator
VLEKRFEELKLTRNLPSPHGVGLALLQITQRDDASIDEVVRVLQTDPTLTGRILKMANSVALGGAQPATTVREAAMRLGLNSVRNVSLGFSLLAGNRTGRCASFDYPRYWSHSLATAVAGQSVAVLCGGLEPSEAFTCGLLAGIGRLALASIHPDAYGSVLERAVGQSFARLAEIELEAFGTHHRELAAAMLRDWKLPAAYSEAVSWAGSGAAEEPVNPKSARLARALQCAGELTRAMTVPLDAPATVCRAHLEELAALCSRLGLDAAGFNTLWTRCVEDWKRWGDTMKVSSELLLSLDEMRERSAQSEADGRPLPQNGPPEADPAPRAAANPRAGVRVLLVDADTAVSRLLALQLVREGHQVSTAASGEQALGRALEQAPHVLVADWNLAGMSGLELVRTLRQSELGKRVHVILLAGRDEEQRVLEAFESGVDEFLIKPCDAVILQARVRAAQRVVGLNDRVDALLRERENQLSQLAILNRKLQAAAITDALTGLPNRRYAMERLDAELGNAARDGKPLSVILIDIDRFKAVNDRHGHDVGDKVLREVSEVLRRSLRRWDGVCRWGGEEFLVVCPNTSLQNASMVAERLRVNVRDHVISMPGFANSVTLSLGVAQLDGARANADDLVRQADQRVYRAKQDGRDRVVATDEPAARQRAG